MAGKNIKGITIEIDGNATGLDKALKGVNGTSVKLNSELKDVNKLLKFDPSNTTLLAQKQELLTKSIDNTKSKLDALKSAQAQVEEQFKSGKIGEEQYRAFQRELTQTEQSLKSYESQLSKMQAEQQKLGQNTDRLNTYFEASGKSIDDYSDILGTRLVNAIKDGTVTSDQLELALNKIGREAVGAQGDITQFKHALDGVKSGDSIDQVRTDLEGLSPAADEAETSINDMTDAITGGNMINAGEVISGVGDKIIELGGVAKDAALEYESATGSLNANTTLTGQELENLKGVATDVFKSGVTDSIDEAVQATSVMKSAFGDLNNQDLGNLTEQVITLSTRTGTDVQENVRGASQLMNAFGIDAQSAFDLMASGYQNNLNASGDFTDTLVEYSPLFSEAGYSADRMLQTLKNGMDAGAMNTDKVADAVKEVQVRLGDGSFEQNLGSFSEETQATFQKWKDGKATVSEVLASITQDLNEVDPTKQQELLSLISTQFEDLGIKGAQGLSQIGTSFSDVGSAMETASEKDPAQKWQASWNEFSASMQTLGADILTALQPVLDFVAKLAEGFSNLPGPVRTIIEVLGGVIAVITVLMPLFASFAIVLPVLGIGAGGAAVGFGALSMSLLPIIAIIAAVIAVIAAVILVIQNWGAIVDWLKGVWEPVAPFFSQIFAVLQGVFNGFKPVLDIFVSFFTNTINNIMTVFNGFISILQGIFNIIVGIFTLNGNKIGQGFAQVFNGLISVASGILSQIINVVTSSLGVVANIFSGVLNAVLSTVGGIFKGILNAITHPMETAKGIVKGIIDAIKGFFSFSISWPHIPMPHFGINPSGWKIGDLLKGSIPSLSVDWYANGGILTKPTIFGTNGNSLMGGGEAGKEAVAPLSDLMGYVEAAVYNQMGTMRGNLEQMIRLLATIAQKNTSFTLNGKTLIEETIEEYMAKSQAITDRKEILKKGRVTTQ